MLNKYACNSFSIHELHDTYGITRRIHTGKLQLTTNFKPEFYVVSLVYNNPVRKVLIQLSTSCAK